MSDIDPKDIPRTLAQLLEDFLKKKAEYEETRIKCGIVGLSGVGKSSLINAITGEKLAQVGGFKEITKEAHEYIHRGLILVDLPGCGTPNFPADTYVEKFKLQTYDVFIFLTADRFFEADKTVYSQLHCKLQKRCFLARAKFDRVLEDAGHDEANLTETEIREQIERDVRDNLAPNEVEKVYMVSARRPTRYDLPSLLADIQRSFDGMKRFRLENDLASWSSDALAKKRANAMRITSWYAAAAAVNGLNPIPGLNIAVDVAVLLKLSNELASLYGLSQQEEDYWKSILKGAHGQAAVKQAVSLTMKYGSEAAITTILKALGKSEIPKAFASVLPVAGQLLAGVAGAGLTYKFGKDLVDEYHSMAEKLLEQLRLEE